MTLIDMSLLLVLVGLGLWLVTTYVPLAGGIKRLLNVVLFVVTLVDSSDENAAKWEVSYELDR